MRTHNNRNKTGLRIEWLEERNAPSRGASLASALETLHHHGTGREHMGRVNDVRTLHRDGQGKDDGANHDVNDQRGRDKDDPANHDQNDNKGVTAMSHDDPPSHDTKNPHDGHGHDDGTGHH